ncbi:hypothetical protein [Vulcanisaeta sp. JCM 14467]|uniref:hypothetical protein n=1 Tax=Vulcanisaeta sp. JCM 14467 TaxID=1295370 RepID=UPI000A5BCBB6|nr:hypothetical protein [Vulcanisaeta sp. JCM 14467]
MLRARSARASATEPRLVKVEMGLGIADPKGIMKSAPGFQGIPCHGYYVYA